MLEVQEIAGLAGAGCALTMRKSDGNFRRLSNLRLKLLQHIKSLRVERHYF
jgi:hypothetical protein